MNEQHKGCLTGEREYYGLLQWGAACQFLASVAFTCASESGSSIVTVINLEAGRAWDLEHSEKRALAVAGGGMVTPDGQFYGVVTRRGHEHSAHGGTAVE